MKILKKIKAHLFLLLIVFIYASLFILDKQIGISSVKNSVYYIKEMIMIMPVIFVLTALLDMWVPKEKIVRFLGKEAKWKGIFYSFVLGSISAGPIYAAFPLCKMLYKKGASVRNLVVILSAWAVIKVPMLLNEVKFLGIKFMVIRWIFTVIAILIFSWISAKWIGQEDLPMQTEEKYPNDELIVIERSVCIGCGLCVKLYPEFFSIYNRKAVISTSEEKIDEIKIQEVVASCPVKAVINRINQIE